MVFFFGPFFFCEIVDNVNTDWGELKSLEGFEAYSAIQSSVSFLSKHQIEI